MRYASQALTTRVKRCIDKTPTLASQRLARRMGSAREIFMYVSKAIAISAVLTGRWAAVVARRCLVARPFSGHALVAALLLAMVGPGLAADLAVTDGDTLRLDRTTYRLGGVDAPEIDQTCVNQAGEVWPCGVAARDRLAAHIGNRAVSCKDEGPDPDHKHRRIGICSIEGETATINEWLVREGWAIKLGSSATGRFAPEEADARENRRGFWSGCLAEPLDFRRWNLSAARLVGRGCQPGHQNRTRVKLFQVDTAMPPGCPIKAKFALRAIGYEGIYHLPACRSYQSLKRAHRWFCSEEDASAAGFRKALTCR